MSYEVRTDLPGGDSFPFTGIPSGAMDVTLAFNFNFDNDTAASSNDGTSAVYEFTGTGSWIDIGANRLDATSLTVTLTDSGSSTTVLFDLYNEVWGVSAIVYFLAGPDDLLDLPTSLDPFSPGEISINTDANMFLIPIMAGSITDAAITPGPGPLALLGLGWLAAARRRR